MKNIAFIPAKGVSKRINKKNMINILDHPLIYYTIVSCLKSKYIQEVWVSSEDKEIINFAHSMGCYCFLRSNNLCQETSSIEDCIDEFIKYYNDYDNIVLIQCTSPYTTYLDLDNAISLLNNNDSIISVTEYKKFLWKKDNNNIIPLTLNNGRVNTQSMNCNSYPFLEENGAFYIFSKNDFVKYKKRYGKNTGYYLMNYSIELDWENDLKEITKIMKHLVKKGYWE